MALNKDSKSEMRQRIAAWISKFAEASDLTDDAIAAKIGLKRDQFNKLKNGHRNALWQEVVLLAQVFKTEAPANLSLESGTPVSKFISLRNSVAIGVWREEDKLMAFSGRLEVELLPSPAFRGLDHYGRRVDDGHADLFVSMGYYVICVDYHSARKALNHGDYVVIQRNRGDLSENGKAVSEISIRRLMREGDRWMLEALCSTPGIVSDLDYDADTDDVRICELIVNRIGPVF